MRRFIALCTFFALLSSGVAYAHLAPGPITGYVNDYAGLLSPEVKATLEQRLVDFHSGYGGEVTVATVESLGGHSIEVYANELFRDWGVGEKDKNNGVLLLIAKQDRQMRIEVGYGYEGVLTDARSTEIIRNTITPYFKQEAYGLGIAAGVKDILTVLETGEVPVEHQDSASTNAATYDIGSWFLYAFIIFPWLASVLGRSKSWWAGGVVGGIVGWAVSMITTMIAWPYIVLGFTLLGLLFDLAVSKGYRNSVSSGTRPPWWAGGSGFGGGSSGGGFGGFGGGSSGGGGASGRW